MTKPPSCETYETLCRWPPPTCRWPSENVSLPLLGPPSPVSVGVPPPRRNRRSERLRSSLHTRRFRLTRAGARTCRCPRCLRRDWQSEASASRSGRRGFLGRSTDVGAGRDERGPTRDLPRSAQGTRPGGAWALLRSGGDLAVLRGVPELGRPCGRSSWRPGGLWASGGVGTVRISFVLTLWSSRPLWASHSRFGALSLTF